MDFHSHIGQDQWVVETLSRRRDGYFLDFGAFDGVTASNTLVLEREFGWKGITVDANPTCFAALCETRSSICVNAALWPTSRESVEMIDAHGLSSMRQFMDKDENREARAEGGRGFFSIDTINPTELLRRYKAPERIEYMSLDLEGAELDVLQAIDLETYQIAIMTIEHGENPQRQEALRAHLRPLGYKVLTRHYDDWFFHPEYVARLQLPGELFNPYAAYEHVRTHFVIA